MKSRQLRHTICSTEQICRGCWEVRTQTEDGRRLTAFGVTLRQAIFRVHHKANAYGRYVYPTAAARERREDVAHIIVTFVQDGSRTYHQRCTAAVTLSRKAMYCDIWSGESLPPDLRCAACGRAIALPLPTSSDLAEQPGGAWRYVAETCVDRHQEPSAGHTMTPWLLERRTGRQRSRDEPTTHEGCSVRRASGGGGRRSSASPAASAQHPTQCPAPASPAEEVIRTGKGRVRRIGDHGA
jgi:hypothetical protein